MNWFLELLMNVVIAGGALAAAFWLSTWVSRKLRELGKKHEELDETLFTFISSVTRYAILIAAILFVLARFGVQTASFVALIGVAGLAVGLALQGTLSSLASGLMLLGFRPFKVGDFIDVAGVSGTVESISLFTVELATTDNVRITVPNGDIWSSAISNYSYYDTRRAELIFGVTYEADLKKTETILRKVIKADKRIHTDPEPFVKVTNLGDSSVDFTVRVWCDRGDLFSVKCDMTRAVKDAFDNGGIDIPFPTITQIQVQG